MINKFRNYVDFLLNESFFENEKNYDGNLIYGFNQINYLELNRPHSQITFENIISYDSDIYTFYQNIKKKNEKKY